MVAQPETVQAQARTPAAARILATASDLFFHRGIHAVGVDTIAAEAGVTKMTLYKHFGSKDALVAAHLRADDEDWRKRWHDAIEHYDEPAERLLAAFDAYEDSLTRGDFRGCAFINAAAEFPDADHPARQVVHEHKMALRDGLTELAKQAKIPRPQEVADRMVLLLEGGWITGSMQRRIEPLQQAREMARRLIGVWEGSCED